MPVSTRNKAIESFRVQKSLLAEHVKEEVVREWLEAYWNQDAIDLGDATGMITNVNVVTDNDGVRYDFLIRVEQVIRLTIENEGGNDASTKEEASTETEETEEAGGQEEDGEGRN